MPEYKGVCHIDDRPPETMFHTHHDLMRFRVRDILLVSTLYDAFIFEEDGKLSEKLFGEYHELDLSSPPRVLRVSSADEALEELVSRRYDMVITTPRPVDMDPFELGRRAKNIHPGIPVVLLVTDTIDLARFRSMDDKRGVDKLFFWTGDSALFLAMTKYVEDMKNVDYDTETAMVRVLLVVEDSPRFYSLFLPVLYTEVMRQTLSLVDQGLNEHEKLLRRMARPKILLAETLEQAVSLYHRYEKYLLGVITDLRFPAGGVECEDAGFKLAEIVDGDIPILIQSSRPEDYPRAESMRIDMIDKKSDTLIQSLRAFFKQKLGFGDFVFMLPDGTEIGAATDMQSFVTMLGSAPASSIKYHGEANHFSNWLVARGEMELAAKLRPKKVSDFVDEEETREHLLSSIREARMEKQMGVVTDFSSQTFEFPGTFTRLGGGSLGGKGRGLAFLFSLMHRHGLKSLFPGCNVNIPETLIIGTEEFDRFMDGFYINLGTEAVLLDNLEEPKLLHIFKEQALPPDLVDSLRKYLDYQRHPIVVRSSSLLEDSQNQPFAGIYKTYMLPNNHEDDSVRLDQLCTAIKLVYSSVFSRNARAYRQSTLHTPEEEKMAVVIQGVVGNMFGDRFYPLFSGVAQSYNFYPISPARREDGIASLALGLGKTVMEGGRVLRFSPAHPGSLPGMSTVRDALDNSQRQFLCLDLSKKEFDLLEGEESTLLRLNVDAAEGDGTLQDIAGVFDARDNRIRDGISVDGPRIINFAGILKYKTFPLAKMLQDILAFGEKGLGGPVEIEFAACLDDTNLDLYILQIRPFVAHREKSGVMIRDEDKRHALAYSDIALGNGVHSSIRDIIFVPPWAFDPSRTAEAVQVIGDMNRDMKDPYILMGPGRWGSRDRWLGIPVEWSDISLARAIVEVSLENLNVDPSHGTHFFHNMTSLGLSYLTVPHGSNQCFVDWDWLKRLSSGDELVHHVRLDNPLLVKIDGRAGLGVVLKPDNR